MGEFKILKTNIYDLKLFSSENTAGRQTLKSAINRLQLVSTFAVS